MSRKKDNREVDYNLIMILLLISLVCLSIFFNKWEDSVNSKINSRFKSEDYYLFEKFRNRTKSYIGILINNQYVFHGVSKINCRSNAIDIYYYNNSIVKTINNEYDYRNYKFSEVVLFCMTYNK